MPGEIGEGLECCNDFAVCHNASFACGDGRPHPLRGELHLKK
jgi:hypothetical protein